MRRKNMTQLNLFSNSWGLNEGFKTLSDKLTELLPFEGRCENPMSKNNFQRIHGFEYVSNMSQMIKIIIPYGLHSHLEAYGSLWSVLKKNP